MLLREIDVNFDETITNDDLHKCTFLKIIRPDPRETGINFRLILSRSYQSRFM